MCERRLRPVVAKGAFFTYKGAFFHFMCLTILA